MINLILLILSLPSSDKIPYCATLSYQTNQTLDYKGTSYEIEPIYNKICDKEKTNAYIMQIKNGTY